MCTHCNFVIIKPFCTVQNAVILVKCNHFYSTITYNINIMIIYDLCPMCVAHSTLKILYRSNALFAMTRTNNERKHLNPSLIGMLYLIGRYIEINYTTKWSFKTFKKKLR